MYISSDLDLTSSDPRQLRRQMKQHLVLRNTTMESIPPTEVSPERHVGRHYFHSPQFPRFLGSIQDFESFELNSNLENLYQNDPTAAHKLEFKLIHHSRLSPALFKQLRRKYLGQIGSSGRCEFTIAFHNLLVLCFVEYKQGLPTGVEAHSDVVAQIIAEMDGADTFNQNGEMDGIRIQAILTDGVIFEFYAGNFKYWTIHGGIGLVEEGIPYEGGYQITLPQSEKAPDYLAKLKVVVEVVFDSFLTSYIDGIRAQKGRSERRRRVWENELGRGFMRRKSNSFWDFAETAAVDAHETLRAAHRHRVVNPEEADQMAELGLQKLSQSAAHIPTPDLDWSFLDNWNERAEALMRV